MKELVEVIAKALVDDPDSVVVNEREDKKTMIDVYKRQGKTYAMLSSAHKAKESGIDVVAGYIEPHTRPETMALTEGLEMLPPRKISYNHIELKEFDLEAALIRSCLLYTSRCV